MTSLPSTQLAQQQNVYLQDNPSVPEVVATAMQYTTHLWWDCSPNLPCEQICYTHQDQSSAEQEMNGFLKKVEAELRNPPSNESEQQVVRERLVPAAHQAAKTVFHLQDEHLEVLGVDDFINTALQFILQARQFDSQISIADIYQAARNVLTTNILQRIWGMPVEMNQAIFAYSMLYPYTDNYLDNPKLSGAQKQAFSQRFKSRLEGETVLPDNTIEERIFRLVSLIEHEYERTVYPQVFDSLLAIHNGQTRSLALLQPDAIPYNLDVLGISLEKGGTSTLADGYLAAGELTSYQAQFAFGLGAFLQFGDDLEDVIEDRKAGIQTIFSQTANHWPLDSLTNRALQFGLRIFDLLDLLDTPPALCQFMRRCAFQPFVTAIHGAQKFYTRNYLEQIEQHSAFRYHHLNRQKKWVRSHRKMLLTAIEKLYSSIVN